MSDLQTALALHRFGLGARPGDLSKEHGSLRGAARVTLLEDVARTVEPSPFAGMLTSAELLERFMDFRGERRAARQQLASQVAGQTGLQAPPGMLEPTPLPEVKKRPGVAAKGPAAPSPASSAGTPAPGAVMQPANPVPLFVQDEMAARIQAAIDAPIGFQERLALFWANHFTVASVNPRVRIICGAFEREAIRPHVAGRFEDMLQAAESHAAMLLYLDNAVSFGPNSRAGRNRKRGLNENLAREILELHTLGVDGGYTQSDVTRFAEVLTGWSIVGAQANGGSPGTFIFRPQMHEPGSRRVLSRDYPQTGVDQGRAVLDDLARHPSTARHVATKLVRHFIADVPPPLAVRRVAEAFTTSKGQLLPVYEALLSLPEAWEPAPRKLRTPYEYSIALVRALRVPLRRANGETASPELLLLMRALNLMGQPAFAAPSPKGWPDETAAWTGPDSIRTRLDLAEISARKVPTTRPLELAQEVLGPLLSDETRTAIRRAESSHQALALMLMSPGFQRR